LCPWVTGRSTELVVTAGGAGFTVRMAAVVVALPPGLVNTAWYWLPESPRTVAAVVKVVDVAPGMSVKVAPPSVLTCHCTVNGEAPDAAAVKAAVWPSTTVWSTGFVVTTGGSCGAGSRVGGAPAVGAVPAGVGNRA